LSSTVLTSTLVLGINYFVIITSPLHPIPVRKRSSSSLYRKPKHTQRVDVDKKIEKFPKLFISSLFIKKHLKPLDQECYARFSHSANLLLHERVLCDSINWMLGKLYSDPRFTRSDTCCWIGPAATIGGTLRLVKVFVPVAAITISISPSY